MHCIQSTCLRSVCAGFWGYTRLFGVGTLSCFLHAPCITLFSCPGPGRCDTRHQGRPTHRRQGAPRRRRLEAPTCGLVRALPSRGEVAGEAILGLARHAWASRTSWRFALVPARRCLPGDSNLPACGARAGAHRRAARQRHPRPVRRRQLRAFRLEQLLLERGLHHQSRAWSDTRPRDTTLPDAIVIPAPAPSIPPPPQNTAFGGGHSIWGRGGEGLGVGAGITICFRVA